MGDSADDAGVGAAELRSELAAPNPSRRAAALARVGLDPHAEHLVIEALQDPEPEVRLASVRALANRHGQRATEALIEAAAGDLSPAVRAEALAVLARILEARAPHLRTTE
jgi:HEAT repeat protein